MTASHRGEKDDRRGVGDGRVEPAERPHVLVVQIDVDEGRDVAIAQDLRAEARVAGRDVVEHLAHRRALSLDLSRTADLGPKRRWDADRRHDVTCVAPPWQNST